MKIIFKNTVLISSILVIYLSNAVGQTCNGNANCIRLDQCEGLRTQLQYGVSAQLRDLLRSLHCGFDINSQPMICCPPEFLHQLPVQRVDPTTLLPSSTECGRQITNRIVGGVQTEIDEHPWMALLRYDKPNGWGFYCGGVLISDKYVMTAAHCVGGDLPSNWRLSQVRLGEWNTSSSVDCVHDDCTKPVQDVPIENIIPHEGYNSEDTNQFNDIALLRLSRPVRYNDFVRPICLPLTAELKRSRFERYEMEVAGWGKTENRSESTVKLKALVPVVSNSQCANVFAKVNRVIRDSQICAGGTAGRDSCRGDSGGPLMGLAPSSSSWMVLGVVSYGPSPCGTEGWPGVYTRVGAYVDWILSKLNP